MPQDIYQIPARIHENNFPEEDSGDFRFHIDISTNGLDSYGTHMDTLSLENFARDASGDGIQFLDSHRSDNLGYGRSFEGRVESNPSAQPEFNIPSRFEGAELGFTPDLGLQTAVLGIRTVPGIEFNSSSLTYKSTDDFIRAIKARLVREVSAGFYGGEWRCDVCGENYLSYRSCPHIAAIAMPVGENGERQVFVTVTVSGANLAEASAVYSGATPGAAIRSKIEAMNGKRGIDYELLPLVNKRYELDLSPNKVWAKRHSGTAVSDDDPNEEANMNFLETFEAGISERASILGLPSNASNDQALTRLLALVDEYKSPAVALAIADGEGHRKLVVEDALKEGVRALEDKFNRTFYETMFADCPLEEISATRDHWATLADEKFKHEGRHTQDGNEGDSDGDSDGNKRKSQKRSLPVGAVA